MTTEEKKTEQPEHVHDENCDHDHDHEDDDGTGHKASKGEKKFKKAIGKMGMKPVEGIERVTLRTQKDFIMYIDNPEVVTTGTAGSYIIFGEAKFLDFSQHKTRTLIDQMNNPNAPNAGRTEIIQEEADEEETEDAGDIPEDSIKTLIEYSSCSRAKAIKCLKKTKGDVVEAISLASSN